MNRRKYNEEGLIHKHRNSENEFNKKLIDEAQECFDKNQMEQSNYLYQEVLRLNPTSVSALNGLGLIAMKVGMMSLAVEFLSSACEHDPENMAVNKNLALALTRSSNYDDAILQYIGMLDIDENDSEIHAELAKLNKHTGHLDMALHYYRHAFYLNPENPENLHGIVQIDMESIVQEDIDIVESILNRSDLSLEKRCSFYYALGNIYDARSRYDEAFANYSVANMCKGDKFDPARHTDYVSDVIDTFSSRFFEQIPTTKLNASTQPVFIVGMPYSGTTLVEQILQGHPGVYTAGESKFVEYIAENLGITNEDVIKYFVLVDDELIDSLNDMSELYLSNINNQAMKEDHINPQLITNKVQVDFTYLGLIALLFPGAKIIHCRRNVMDVCLASFFHDLPKSHAYGNDLRTVALYYQQYERLMAHWEKVLPIDIHTVNYEEILSNTKTSSKQLMEYINIEWQPQCLDFYNTKNKNARYGECKSTLDKWQYYDKYLHLLKKTLGIGMDYYDDEEIITINPHDFKKDFKASKFMH